MTATSPGNGPIAVTGASGYGASHVVAALVRRGHDWSSTPTID